MPLKLLRVVAILLLSGVPAKGAQLELRHGGSQANGEQDWFVLLQPDAVSAVAVEIGFQFTGGAIVRLEPNTAVFDDHNPGQNPFTGSVTAGVSIHNGGSAAFASLGGVIPEVVETRVLTIVTNGAGTLSLGGHNHNGSFTGARVWQGASPVDGLTASLQVAETDADFDQDGAIDGADFLTWQRGLGISMGAARADGDANSDGAVDGVDLSVWKSQFGVPAAVAAVAPIPEPATISGAMLMGATLACLARRRSE